MTAMVEGLHSRCIVHLSVPDFCAAVEERRHPELRRCPFVLSQIRDRAVVQGVNAAARKEGVREGMPLGAARRLCRRLTVLPPDPGLYRERHRGLLGELERFSPLAEGPAPGSYVVDITGTRRLWGPAPDAACRMAAELVSRSGFYARVGIAASKLVSQVAAEVVPPGDLNCIFPGGESAFLSPLPVSCLPGVGSKTAEKLADLNIRRIAQLASLPAESVFGVFGRQGLRLLQLARGVDPSPVLPSLRMPRLRFACILDRDGIDSHQLESRLFRLTEEAGWNLRRWNRSPGRLTLEVHYADGVSASARCSLASVPASLDRRLFFAARSAVAKAFRRRTAVRRIVLELCDFSMPARQLSLFSWEDAALDREEKLQKALDAVRNRFGREAIAWGKGLGDAPAVQGAAGEGFSNRGAPQRNPSGASGGPAAPGNATAGR